MANKTEQPRDHWATKLGFVLAASGSAIGLGNIWRFPYKAGQYGGGAFVIAYVVSVLIIGIPIMIAEFIIGRSAQKSPVGAFKQLSFNRAWPLVGWLGVLSGFIILSYYSVVGGWILRYIWESGFHFFKEGSAGPIFSSFLANPWQQLIWHGLFMFMTMIIVRGGITTGIERWSKVLMPSLLIILLILMINSLRFPGAGEGIQFILKPDFSKLTREGILEALGHAFFSLSLGMGAMLTYGSYLDKGTNISSSALEIVVLNTFYALMAGLMIFPIVFTYDVDPQVGPGLFFITLPEVFARMPAGQLVAISFFVLVAFAAITSAISLLEVVVSYFIDELNWSRKKADYVMGTVIFLIGIPSALSWSSLKGVTLFGSRDIFDSLDFLATNYMLPIGGFFIALFAGWILTHGQKEAEIKRIENTFHFYDIWHFLVKYIAPLAVLVILLQKTGVLPF
ncbi:MAG: sodium-dependent transporter [Deltaproteobacteria bacterium]|jgi:NSS family neurotransmitter:Na+ symporter|nr:sodium-dependent transporter [Deltaproteobacteria bacterium]